MMFKFAGALLRVVNYKRSLDFDARTVQESLDALIGSHPALKTILLDENDQIRTSHRLYLNGVPMDHEDMTNTLESDDCIQIVTAVAGG